MSPKVVLWIALLLPTLEAGYVSAADDREAKDDEPTLFERLMITPREDAFSQGDRKRAQIERSLPGMTTAPPPESGWDEFIDMLAGADINKATPAQRTMIEKLDDPDFNRLPR